MRQFSEKTFLSSWASFLSNYGVSVFPPVIWMLSKRRARVVESKSFTQSQTPSARVRFFSPQVVNRGSTRS